MNGYLKSQRWIPIVGLAALAMVVAAACGGSSKRAADKPPSGLAAGGSSGGTSVQKSIASAPPSDSQFNAVAGAEGAPQSGSSRVLKKSPQGIDFRLHDA
jgi:hypothetical protein